MEPKVRSDRGAVPPAVRPKLVKIESGVFAIFTWNDVVVVRWLGKRATGPFVRLLADATGPLIAGFPRKISVVHMVTPRGELPTAEGRAGLTEIMDRDGKHVACVAIILPESGFWASAFQGFITGMHMVAPRSFALRIESSVAGVAQWLPHEHLQRTGTFIDPAELAGALKDAWSWALPPA